MTLPPLPAPEAEEIPFVSHLVELRTRLIRAVAAVLVVALCLIPFASELYTLLAQPLREALPKTLGGNMIATDVVSGFLIPLKVALMTAFLITLPYVLYQLWAFVAPGLYTHEKRLALPLLVMSVLLFFVGMAFAYFLVFPTVFHFMARVMPEGVTWMTDMEKYVSFAVNTFLAFGAAFEVPVVVILLARTGIVSLQRLREIRRYFIVAAFVIAAVLTPPDILSQFMLAVPMCLLYELGIFMARFLGTKETPKEKAP